MSRSAHEKAAEKPQGCHRWHPITSTKNEKTDPLPGRPSSREKLRPYCCLFSGLTLDQRSAVVAATLVESGSRTRAGHGEHANQILGGGLQRIGDLLGNSIVQRRTLVHGVGLDSELVGTVASVDLLLGIGSTSGGEVRAHAVDLDELVAVGAGNRNVLQG